MPATSPGTARSGPRLGPAILAVGVLCFLLIVIGTAGIFGGGDAINPAAACGQQGEATEPSAETRDSIPENYLRFYQAAGEDFGIPWQILAGIGSIETDHGRLNAPGVSSGENSSGAGGPMQFLQPTWDQYGVDGDGDGDRDRYDPADAIPGAANYLVASGIKTSVHDALFAYNRAEWYVADVISRAQGYGWTGDGTGGISTADPPESASGAPGGGGGGAAEESGVVTPGCNSEFPAGPAQLNQAVKLSSPGRYVRIPPEYTGGAVEEIDSRILPNVVWIAQTYDLLITQGRGGRGTGSPSVSHNYGTGIDMVPANGNSQAEWDRTAGRLASDLGWAPSCGGQGTRPACDLVPAIRFVGYDGYENHGSPRTCSGGCPAHIHVSWEAGDGASYDGVLRPPLDWVMVFPSPDGSGGSGGAGGSSAGGVRAAGSSAQAAGETLMVGDSLGVGTGPYLRRQLGDRLTLDVVTGRSSTAGLSALRSALTGDQEAVVFDLGTNDGSASTLRANLRAAADAVGDRCMVVATINHRGGASAYNEVITDFADASDDVELVDWDAMTESEPSLLAGDGIHATAEGYARRGSAMLSALGRC